MLVQNKISILFAIELRLREISFVVYMHALICAVMAPKLCTVGMRNALLRNHLKIQM